MTKKSLLWICLGVVFLTGLIVLGSILTKNMEENMPTAAIVPSTEPTTGSSQPVQSQPAVSEPADSEAGETELPTESTDEPATGAQSTNSGQVEDVPRPTPPPTVPPTSEGEDLQARINALVDEVYGLRDYYVAQLNYLETSAHEEYDALPPAQQTEEKRRSMALHCVDEAYAMENECDARMDEICSELALLLLKTGGKMNLVNEIRYAYAKEKEQAKTEFLERYAVYFG